MLLPCDVTTSNNKVSFSVIFGRTCTQQVSISVLKFRWWWVTFSSPSVQQEVKELGRMVTKHHRRFTAWSNNSSFIFYCFCQPICNSDSLFRVDAISAFNIENGGKSENKYCWISETWAIQPTTLKILGAKSNRKELPATNFSKWRHIWWVCQFMRKLWKMLLRLPLERIQTWIFARRAS